MNSKETNVLALLILVLACAAVISGCGGLKEIPQKDSELIGVTLSASERLFYMEGCNISGSCGETKTVREVDRALVCRRLNTTVTHIYDNNYEINKKTAFKVVKVFDVECYGLRCAFSSGYPLVVLEDSQGVLSTYLRFFIDFEERDVCGFSF